MASMPGEVESAWGKASTIRFVAAAIEKAGQVAGLALIKWQEWPLDALSKGMTTVGGEATAFAPVRREYGFGKLLQADGEPVHLLR